MKKIIILSGRLYNTADNNVLNGILRYVNRVGNWQIRLIIFPESLTVPFAHAAIANGYDGVIINHLPDKEHDARIALMNLKLPLVAIQISSEAFKKRTFKTALVYLRNTKCGELAANKFLSLGKFKSYAFVGDPECPKWSEFRKKGFVDTLGKSGIAVRILDGQDIASAIRQMPKPAAIMAAWDAKALQVIEAANTMGLNIPKEISVIGVDADPLLCNSCSPALTSVFPDFERVGYTAAATLDALMSGRKRGNLTKVYCNPRDIIERQSTRGTPPSESLLKRAHEIITRESTKGLSTTDLAVRLHVSKQLLSLRFKQAENTSPGELIIQTKLKCVKKSLAKSSASIATIAKDCGFNSQNRLSHLFKERFGLSMREWRRSNGN